VRGEPERQLQMLAMTNLEDFVPGEHPIRRIGALVDAVLAGLDPEFSAMDAPGGRPSVQSEQLLKAACRWRK
jgi:hypothetical protein